MNQSQEVGRLALRVEGEFWNAYWAPRQDSLSGAILLASARFSIVDGDGKLKDMFMELAKAGFSRIILEATGQKPRWNQPQPAPERERAGNG